MSVGRSIQKYERISPKKLKPFLELVRGKDVKEAKRILTFLPNKKPARLIHKALKAALASYREKAPSDTLPEEELVVSCAKVDKGPTFKRIRAAWRGRAVLIRKRTSHITIEVTERRI